jgi:moderate conductance mechanosensitive channel
MPTRNIPSRYLSPDFWMLWTERGIRVIVILALAWLLTRITQRLLRRLRGSAMRAMNKRGDVTSVELDRRSATVVSVLGKVATVVIWLGALVMALNELAFKIEPILAGFGVVGLAVGLGAQTLIKDWLGGVLILVEDQIRIGDVVTINTTSGVVEELNLRTTVLRGENGAVYVISNGSITTLANMTREFAYYLFEATLAHGSNIDRAIEILREVGKELAAEPQFEPVILAPMEVMGVDRLSDRGVTIRARIQTIPSQQWGVGRELNRRVQQRWEAEGIRFPRVLA